MERLLSKDPGLVWNKVADSVMEPRFGFFERVLAPRVVILPDGMLRMYFCVGAMPQKTRFGKILRRLTRTNRITGGIRSAVSNNGQDWRWEPGKRVFPDHETGEISTVSPDVVRLNDGSYRMYYQSRSLGECDVVRSAFSADGLRWRIEKGMRFGQPFANYGSPKCMPLEGGGYRLYFHEYPAPFKAGLDAGNNIISAISQDGLLFSRESGVRISQQSSSESYAVYAPEVLRLSSGLYRMYYSGWSCDPRYGRIFSATSTDGIKWTKTLGVCLDIGGRLQEKKVSEPSVVQLSDHSYDMYYEASDQFDRWRIFRAQSKVV